MAWVGPYPVKLILFYNLVIFLSYKSCLPNLLPSDCSVRVKVSRHTSTKRREPATHRVLSKLLEILLHKLCPKLLLFWEKLFASLLGFVFPVSDKYIFYRTPLFFGLFKSFKFHDYCEPFLNLIGSRLWLWFLNHWFTYQILASYENPRTLILSSSCLSIYPFYPFPKEEDGFKTQGSKPRPRPKAHMNLAQDRSLWNLALYLMSC